MDSHLRGLDWVTLASPAMPVCPHPKCNCGHKDVNAAVLSAHVSSAAWGSSYYCTKCKCVCRSPAVLKDHMSRVHRAVAAGPPLPSPPASSINNVNLCKTCNRQYSSAPALQQHFRDSTNHPSCGRCDLGFRDPTALNIHIQAVHVPITCAACGGLQVYREDVLNHYRVSPNHPRCTKCPTIGFASTEAFEQHIASSHPEFRCKACAQNFSSEALLEGHYRDSLKHPTCPECKISFIDDRALAEHVLAVFNPLLQDSTKLAFKVDLERENDLPQAKAEASSVSSPPAEAAETPIRSGPVDTASFTPSGPPNSHNEDVSNTQTSSPSGMMMSSNARAASLSTAPTLQSTVQMTPEKKIQSLEDDVELDLPLREDEDSVSMDGAPVVAPEIRPSLTVLVSPQPIPPAPTHSYQSSTSSGRDDDKIHGLQSVKAGFNDRSVTSPRGSLSDSLKPLLTPKISATNTLKMFLPPSPHSPHNALSGRGSNLSHHLYSDSARATSPAASLTARSYHDHFNNSTPHTPSGSPGARQMAPSLVLNRLPSQVATSPTPSHVHSASVMNLFGQQLKSPSTPASANSLPGVSRSLSSPLSVPRSRERLEQSDQTAKTVSHVYCRLCRRDPCRGATATMCGHIFCNSCIKNEVVKSSCCPECGTPLLLYCLFRLRIS